MLMMAAIRHLPARLGSGMGVGSLKALAKWCVNTSRFFYVSRFLRAHEPAETLHGVTAPLGFTMPSAWSYDY